MSLTLSIPKVRTLECVCSTLSPISRIISWLEGGKNFKRQKTGFGCKWSEHITIKTDGQREHLVNICERVHQIEWIVAHSEVGGWRSYSRMEWTAAYCVNEVFSPLSQPKKVLSVSQTSATSCLMYTISMLKVWTLSLRGEELSTRLDDVSVCSWKIHFHNWIMGETEQRKCSTNCSIRRKVRKGETDKE